jgi:hypothetical protein
VSLETWRSPEWREQAVAWLDDRLAAAGTTRIGDVEQPHLQPWATALTAPTTRGPVWLKAMAPWTAGEIGVYDVLRRAAPERALAPIAADPARGWLLLPDGGPTLGTRLEGDVLVDALLPVMSAYGRFQRDVAPHADELVAAGVDDMRPAAMPARFEEALDVVREYVARHGTDDDRDLVHRVEARRGAFHGWCERLAESPVPPSLDHNDLHAWNVLGGDGEEPRFYDWGDAVVSHPFASMLMGLGFTKFYVEVSGDADPRLTRLRDAYLEPFADLAPHHELVSTLELACRVGKVARTLVWDRAVRSMGDAAGEAVRTPLISLGSVLDESYVGVT